MTDDALIEQHWEERKRELCRSPILIGAAAVLKAAQLHPPFLIKNRIPLGGITFIAGQPGGGKSWLGYDLVLAAVQGRAWLGCELGEQVPSDSRALIFNYDNPTGELGRRMLRLGMRAEDRIWFHSPEAHALKLPEKHEDLRAIVEHIDPTVILIDSFRQCMTADENSSKEMSEVMGHLKMFARRGAAVVVIHHSNKSAEAIGQARVRGTGEITASADCLIVLDGDQNSQQATWNKHRSWRLEELDATIHFSVIDRGELTMVIERDC